MNIFASAARGKFLTQALIAAGLTEDAIASAQAAGTADFLGKLGDEQAAAASKAIADLAAANERLAKIDAGLKSLALLPTGAEGYSLEALTAAVEAREAAARKAGEEAATLRAAQELAARGHAPVATAPAAAEGQSGSLADQYSKLSGARERAEFIKAHGANNILASIRRGGPANN